ncbi:hypothetical protein BSKO_07403 [Bryopsis sp. KO-2023]|nr:hypothetical protein BSKO_07403 [Bryopsis sp. KO-2023]
MDETQAPLLDTSNHARKRNWKTVLEDKWRAIRLSLREPTHRNLVIMATFIGIISGLISLAYSYSLDRLLHGTWKWFPETVLLPLLEKAHARWEWFPAPTNVGWIYTVFVASLFGATAGMMQILVGDPGDMPSTFQTVHSEGIIPIKTAPAMYLCSTFSIVAGASVGPEAPVLAVCGAAISWLSQVVMGHSGQMLKSCTLMGMAAGLTSLFGVSFGGAVFAFEVLHTNGLQYYETLPYGVFASILCLAVHRGLWNLEPFGQIWTFEEVLQETDTRHIGAGFLIGLLAIVLTLMFQQLFAFFKSLWGKLGLVDCKRPVVTGLVGGIVVGIIGVFLPATMFWSEFEMGTVADDSVPLEHVWPKGGFWGLTPFRRGRYTMGLWFLLGFVKLVTITASVVSGLRGGFIFPLMFAGACIGQGLAAIPGIPWWSALPSSLIALSLGGAFTTGITRTPFACTLILSMLSGIPQATVPTLVACLVTFFGTMDRPFFKTQQNRPDIVILEAASSEAQASPVCGGGKRDIESHPPMQPRRSDSVQSYR